MSEAVLLIGIGNEFRSDDAVGLLAARACARWNLSGLRVIECNGEGASLMEAWKGGQRVLVVDAVSSGSAPGTLHRVELSERGLQGNLVPRSSHAFGLAEAVKLAQQLRCLPPHLTLYGLEGESFGFGDALSRPVAAGLSRLILTIEHDLTLTLGAEG